MGWSGGTYRKGNYGTNGWTGDASLGIGIEAGRHDTQDDDFQNGINQCLNKDGSNAATGNLNLGANRITNVGAGTARNDAATVAQVQDNTSSYLGTTGGTSTAFTVTATPTITALTTGAQYVFKANAANGAAATLKIDGTAATTMQRQGTALAGNEFKANDMVSVVYDGTNFQITNIAEAPLFVDRTNNRVGIGTTAPTYDFEVAGTATRCQITRFSADTGGTQIDFAKSRGATVGTNTIVQSGDILGVLRFSGANGTGFTEAAYVAGWCDGTPGASNDMPGRITFATTADGAGTASERMRITAGGFLFVNTTTNFSADRMCLAYDATQNGLGIRDNNDTSGTTFAVFRNSTNGICGSVTRVTTTNAVHYNTSSDYRLKENVAPIADGLQRTLQLKPVSFDWIDSSESSEGFIAHEVAEVFPHAVSGIKDDIDENGQPKYQGVDYGKITPILTAAIKELNAKVEALEARVLALEA